MKSSKLPPRYHRYIKPSLAVVGIALVGIVAIIAIRAASPTANFEAESGNFTGNACVFPDQSASGNSAAMLGDTCKAIEVVGTNLETPWSMAWLPNGDMLVTERSGRIQRLSAQGVVYNIPGVTETSEGGLLGLELHPDFANNRLLYIYKTSSSGGLHNRIEQYRYDNDTLTFQRVILSGIPAASVHDGGELAFGPDGKLYAATGDAASASTSQDTSNLAGKILRMNDDGSVPADNPFGNLVWSYGHRNPQGIAWDSAGRMWSVEHGPSGEGYAGKGSGKDELNLIEKGANYGWPVIAGDETRPGMRSPIAHSGSGTWAPSGIAFLNGSLYFAGLRGQTLYEARINSNGASVTLSEHLRGEYGRLRAVKSYQQNLYVSTSNRDGRGNPGADDDKILQIDVAQLN